ncbi:hypothetical protein GCM10023172_33810 [Hymenobacter ginsengisoli]|uniref:Cytochrome c domain-containing protein n=1 Tax=Hymenobacter ginsengisoli TaxID=1051626 RepID=A0ABP8QM01_9BACT|nr:MULTISPECIES: cytochrome c [unclassified Hymenobacter]MBO2031082.1 c-type cytochrome [Hymenobacter sp. BT559]
MKKTLRLLSWAAGLLVLAAAGFAAYVSLRGVPRYPVPTVGQVLPSTPARLAHGEQLATMMCMHCHRDPATNTFSGRALPEVGTALGQLHSANITQDPVYGIGKWTDVQLVGLLRTGIGADGRMRLVMPHFAYLSDEDAASLVAFLRSGDALVRATPTAQGPQQVSFLAKALTNTVMKPTPLLAHPADAPPATDPVALGHYLVVARYQCYYCHSRDFSTINQAHPEQSENYLGGGNAMLGDKLEPRVSRNLTMDPETGLGDWSEAQFSRAIQAGMSPHGPLYEPMPKFTALTNEEAHAIWAYLQTVPKIRNATPEDGALAGR